MRQAEGDVTTAEEAEAESESDAAPLALLRGNGASSHWRREDMNSPEASRGGRPCQRPGVSP